jgi:hypothetical protein
MERTRTPRRAKKNLQKHNDGIIPERTLEQLAHDSGLHPVACPHCGKPFQILDFIDELFWAIAGAVREGEHISVHNWGLFYPRDFRVPNEKRKQKGRTWPFRSMQLTLAQRAKQFFRGEWHPDDERPESDNDTEGA